MRRYLFAALAALLCLSAFAQQKTNPGTGIDWTTASGCTVAGEVYSPEGNVCVAVPSLASGTAGQMAQYTASAAIGSDAAMTDDAIAGFGYSLSTSGHNTDVGNYDVTLVGSDNETGGNFNFSSTVSPGGADEWGGSFNVTLTQPACNASFLRCFDGDVNFDSDVSGGGGGAVFSVDMVETSGGLFSTGAAQIQLEASGTHSGNGDIAISADNASNVGDGAISVSSTGPTTFTTSNFSLDSSGVLSLQSLLSGVGDCVQIGTGGSLTSVGSPCGGGGTVGTQGTVTAAFYPIFYDSTHITNGSLEEVGGVVTSSEPLSITGSVTDEIQVGNQAVNLTALTGAGTGATVGCTSGGYVCTLSSGTVTLNTGTGTPAGPYFQIATAGSALPNLLNCTITSTNGSTAWAATSTTSYVQVTTWTALLPSTSYQFTYNCGD